MLQISVLLLVAFFTIAGTAATESRDITVVHAMEIIAKIERGEPANYDAVTIDGDLNLSKSDLPNENYNISDRVLQIPYLPALLI